ncbi:hypothetical protein [Halorarum salinum]|uniref:hypothetical protein n=1 Tax=Halorarum salinum TaxID=2743089 RepID=UPI001FE2ADDB|nr:hypothetical protein [Halobaculum salinum]
MTSDRFTESFPSLREEIGEDPARFLDVPLLGSTGASTPFGLARARIRGIDEIGTAKAWLAVERALGRGDDDGPRERVVDLLEARIDDLEEHGERPSNEQLVMSWGGWAQTSTGRETFLQNYLGPVPDHVTAQAFDELPLA